MTTVPGLQRDTVALTDLLHLVKASGGDPRDRAQLVSELRGLILPPVKDRDVADPSTLTPTEGDTYIVAASGVGDWAGQDGNIAVYVNETIDGTTVAWRFIPVAENMLAFVLDEGGFFKYDGTAWAVALQSDISFLDLTDTPAGYTNAGYLVQINSGGNGLEFVNPATLVTNVSVAQVLAPEPISPANGATDVGETPTIDGGPFYQIYNKSHALSKFQVASNSDFSTIVYDSGEISGTTTHEVPPGNLITSTTYYWRAWYEDEDGNRSDWSGTASFTTANSFVFIYGIAQVSTGGGAGSWQWIDGEGNNLTLTPSDFDTHPTWGGIADTTIDGQAMVKIPAFYYKVGTAPAGSDQAGKKCWWIGNGPFSGSQLHPAFMSGGAATNQVYVGKYEGIDDGTNGSGSNIVGSASGMSPLVETTFTNYAQYCENRNEANGGNAGQTGWHLWSMYELGAIQMLALIELETPDVQSAIASGHGNSSSAVNTGSTSAVYRGIYELWGNSFHWTHGLEIDGNGVVSIWDRDGNQTWVNTGVTAGNHDNNDGWIVTTHDDAGTDYDLADVFLPETTDGTESNGTYADYIFGSDLGEVNKVLQGGDWNTGSRNGLFYLVCSLEASHMGNVHGGRLAKI